jgi:hypothetical protein
MTINEDVNKVLEFLSKCKRDEMGFAFVRGPEIQKGTKLTPAQINDAIKIAGNRGWIDRRDYGGTAPFMFGEVNISAEGRLFLENS